MRHATGVRWLRCVALCTGVCMTALFAATGPAPAAARHTPAAVQRLPRLGTAMGILPRLGTPEVATGQNIPVVYHGGRVMRDVTIHTVFWAPPGYHFDGSPGAGAAGYEAMVKQFVSDVAHDSAAPTGIFSTLTQYHDGAGAGATAVHYDPAVDSVDLTAPYPAPRKQCASPSSVATCVTDVQIQTALDQLIATSAPSARGLGNLWFVLLPPDVDSCISAGSCATNAFAGYHSLFDLGHGPTVYAPIPDPLVELTPGPGSDPQGNPEAESTLQTIAHEYHEAVTDPYGTAWLDPNGFETGDKCENGPQQSTPLGYAPDGSPYNQIINGHQYLLPDMWSNAARGCVQSSSATGSPLPLHTVALRQFSPLVSGHLGEPRRVPVTVTLVRGQDPIAIGRTTSRADGSWGPVALRGRNGTLHAPGDDHDVVLVSYGSGHGAPTPELIATGNGGNPFTQSGTTGWYILDHFAAVEPHGVALGPCSQVGVLSLRVGASLAPSPVPLCSTETDIAIVRTARIGLGTNVGLTSSDNRAVSLSEPNGALVSLSVALGEPGALPAPTGQSGALATGFPSCTAFLRIRSVRCTGLVPGEQYRIAARTARAGKDGTLFAGALALSGGRALTLVNAAGRRLTTLHVARLRVDLIGSQTVIAAGACQPGDFYGRPLTHAPTASTVGIGPGGGGTACPDSGQAKGLSTTDIAVTDDRSGGQTVTQVPTIASTAPQQDDTLYGRFIASAQSSLPGAHGSTAAAGTPIALSIRPAGSQRRVFHAANVDTRHGVSVPALAPGTYTATWVLHDANRDTRTTTTRFTEQ
ncbi:MAG: EXORDIUM family protein [Actinomycetota bacterium]|nr:EXORDIUM family protein [Actinomycetota bacterium]